MSALKWMGFIIIFILGINLIAQKDFVEKTGDDPVLFSYGKDGKVTLSEFQYVFKKNNANLKNPTLGDIEDYLDLYINFKLKVAEAYDTRVDTLPEVKNDLKNYLEQLFNSYVDKQILEPLMKEAYQRMQEDINISHIMVNLAKDAPAGDTLNAYIKIMNIRERLLKGEDFTKVALDVSEDKFVKDNNGDIGYITGMSIPFYNFENNAFSIPVGKVSMPVRTPLGYHLIKANERRPAMGFLTVGHILIKTEPGASSEDISAAEIKADSIYRRIMGGESFETMASTYSDDQLSAKNGGKLEPFGAGKMVPVFDRTAYGLKKDGDVSKPFQTNFGYHIIKRLSKEELLPYQDMKEGIKKRVQRDERYHIAKDNLIRRYKIKYSLVEFSDRIPALSSRLDSTIYNAAWIYREEDGDHKTLLMLDDNEFSIAGFMKYIQSSQIRRRGTDFEKVLEDHYDNYLSHTVLEYGLLKSEFEYKMLKREYQEGIIMFAAMEKNVWTKAVLDSAGLQEYYNGHIGEYMWDERAITDIYNLRGINEIILPSVLDPEKDSVILEYDSVNTAKWQKKLLKWITKKESGWITGKINSKFDYKPAVTYIRIKSEKGNDDIIDQLWEKGAGNHFSESMNDGTIETTYLVKLVGPEGKQLNESRGAYISDYQAVLEKQWIESLKSKYPVRIDRDVLIKMVN